MKIYTPEASTPAAAITLATGLCNTQPILFTTQFGNTGTYDGCDNSNQPVELKWVIKDIEVSLTRDWGTSTARIRLSYDLKDQYDFPPPLPNVHAYRKGNLPYLSEEDEIRIYAGWVPSTNTPITADLLDETPFNFINIETEIETKQDPSKYLVPIFWGFIDKIEFIGNANSGEELLISCRDRVRVFSDTKIVSLQAFQGKESTSKGEGDDLSGIASGDRVSIILELANAAAGNPFGGPRRNDACWKPITSGLTVRGYTYDKEDPKNSIIKFPHQNPSQWVRTATCRIMNDKAAPRMNAWAERPPIVKGEPSSTLQVLNKTPMEVVDYLAKVEERPMDFFCSHINGDYILGPRVKDTSGFDDPLRSYRTYFYRTYPKDMEQYPSYNQMILKIRVQKSTLFSFNNFVMINATSRGQGVNLIGSVVQGFSAYPTHLANREPSPPCKTQILYDSAIDSYQNPEAGALLLGLANARIWARDTQNIQIEVIGDPTLYPSEAIRVYNTFLHDYQTYTVIDPDKDDASYQETKEQAAKVAETTIKETRTTKATGGSGAATGWISSYLNGPSRLPTDIKNLVLPYYTIRSVQHKLTASSNRGYISVISCVTDI